MFLATFLATLFAPLEYAVLAGVVLNIGLFVRRSGKVRLIELVPAASGAFAERELPASPANAPIVIVQLQGDLFFGQADDLTERLGALLRGTCKVVVLRMRRTQSIDASVLAVLDAFVRKLQARGGHVVLCGIAPDLRVVLDHSGLAARVGPENVIDIDPELFGGLRRAIARAEHLAGTPLLPVPPVAATQWSYSI